MNNGHRLDRLTALWPPPEKKKRRHYDYSSLTPFEQYELAQYLARIDPTDHHHVEPLTETETFRMDQLLAHGRLCLR
jgi:hypothetical protein